MTAKKPDNRGREKRRRQIFLAVGAVISLLILAIFMDLLLNSFMLFNREGDQSLPLPQTELYRNQGLPPGKVLETYPYKVTREHVFFLDRILERYPQEADASLEVVSLLNQIYSQVPSGVGKYYMAIPLRIAYENGMEAYDPDQKIAYGTIQAALSDNAVFLDTWTALESHKQEYIYFRSEDTWTALGAFYGASVLAKATNRLMPELKDYEEHLYISFEGSLVDDSGSLGLAEEYYDRLYFYIHPDGANSEILFKRQEESVIQLEAPTIAKSRGELTAFVGGVFSHSIIKGDLIGGGTLVIVGDTNANILAPWLSALYEEIYVINQRYYLGGPEGFRRIFQEHNVRDLLIVEGMDTMADKDSLSWLRKLGPE